jgi:hypothetical protein
VRPQKVFVPEGGLAFVIWPSLWSNGRFGNR